MANKFLLMIYIIVQSFSLNAKVLFKNIETNEAISLIRKNESNKNFYIIDLRTKREYSREHLKKSINIDYYQHNFHTQLNMLERSKVYLIYCRSGNRSGKTFRKMKKMGFQTCYNLFNGIIDWPDEANDLIIRE